MNVKVVAMIEILIDVEEVLVQIIERGIAIDPDPDLEMIKGIAVVLLVEIIQEIDK
jgi:hypothetical protein